MDPGEDRQVGGAMADFPFPVLVADIGGTNARFALLPAADAVLSTVIRLETRHYESFVAAVEAAVQRGQWPRPATVLVGAAGAVANRSVALTNANWRIDGPAVARQLGVRQGLLLNDFETLALALPAFGADDLHPIGTAAAGQGPALVIGPGTGLGVGALVQVAGRYLPMASEGGHIGLAPATAEEHRLIDRIAPHGGPVPAEWLVAGPGLARLHQAMQAADGPLEPAEVAARALAGSDPLAGAAVQLWLDLLARFAGAMALTFLATGGVYLAGGILPQLRRLIDPVRFRAAFEDHPVHRTLLAGLAIQLIVADEPALIGLAALARAPECYALEYSARLWTA